MDMANDRHVRQMTSASDPHQHPYEYDSFLWPWNLVNIKYMQWLCANKYNRFGVVLELVTVYYQSDGKTFASAELR